MLKPRPLPELRDALEELADINLSVATIYRMARLKQFPVTDVGGRKRSTVAAVIAAMTPSEK
jgi:hypothetical protein